ncbi:MAG TPA: alanine-tRNA synthetase second additional domain-containing protein [Desulfobacteria bacterium]|nr:alanine-tRNA synthetase second additional domain-containing protein [Desulfobacteria bacterium]
MRVAIHEYLMEASYFAPRGKARIIELGRSISHRYLDPGDKLIGLIGDAGAGKSLLIRGIFPGLELTNDDNGINVRPLPLIRDAEEGHFKSHTYHVDVRFETAFTQPYVIAEAVKKAISSDRRVILEHFDLLYPVLEINAEVLIGVGEEVIVTRPGAFGPVPKDIVNIVFPSLKYRKMAHSAEDITAMVLDEMGIRKPDDHSDIRHGFILEFEEMPEVDLDGVERKVLDIIAADEVINYQDEGKIRIGGSLWDCTGPRLHVCRTGDIKGYRLLKDIKCDPISNLYILAGLVGEHNVDIESLVCPRPVTV